MAHLLKEGLDELRPEMEKLLNSGAIHILPPQEQGLFSGLSFCFTGELVGMKRPAAEALVRSLGGSAKSSVVKGLSFLVTNTPDSGSAKNLKARELGVHIIDEAEFLALTRGESKTIKLDELEEMRLNNNSVRDTKTSRKAKSGKTQRTDNSQMELGI